MNSSAFLKEPRDRVIAAYILSTVVLTLIALGFWMSGFNERHAHLLRFIYFDPSAPGRDITLYERFAELPQRGALVFNPPGAESPFNYFPFGALLFYLYIAIPPNPWAALVVTGAVAAFLAAGLLARAIGSNGLAQAALWTAVGTSVPFAFLFQRGNTEGLVWIFSAAGVYFFVKRKYLAAAVFFSLATSIKPIPGILFLLFLPKRRFREFFVSIGLTLAIAVASLAIIGPTIQIAVQETIRGFGAFSKQLILKYEFWDIGTDHSLFSLVKQALRMSIGWPHQEQVWPLVQAAYPYYTGAAFLILCFSIFRLRKMPTLNQIFGLFILMLILSPVNHEYTLIELYIPWAIMLLALSRGDCQFSQRAALWMMICMAILFTSQYYVVFGVSASGGAQVKTLALVAILILALIYPLPTRMLDGNDEKDQRDSAEAEPGMVTR